MPPPKPHRRTFYMPPAFTPGAKASEDIMKISELSSSVDRLISVATNLKNQPAATPPEQPDDPAVQELADKIERAIAVLEGRDGSEPVRQTEAPNFPPPDAPARDPNAPV